MARLGASGRVKTLGGRRTLQRLAAECVGRRLCPDPVGQRERLQRRPAASGRVGLLRDRPRAEAERLSREGCRARRQGALRPRPASAHQHSLDDVACLPVHDPRETRREPASSSCRRKTRSESAVQLSIADCKPEKCPASMPNQRVIRRSCLRRMLNGMCAWCSDNVSLRAAPASFMGGCFISHGTVVSRIGYLTNLSFSHRACVSSLGAVFWAWRLVPLFSSSQSFALVPPLPACSGRRRCWFAVCTRRHSGKRRLTCAQRPSRTTSSLLRSALCSGGGGAGHHPTSSLFVVGLLLALCVTERSSNDGSSRRGTSHHS